MALARALDAEVIIVGGGPAGLSAALLLGRCLREVLFIDDGRPRNERSQHVHGFYTRDGTPPAELLRIGREQLERYGVRTLRDTVTRARRVRERGVFQVETADGRRFTARKLLLATGITDDVPAIDGIEPLYGRSVFHCPYCDGFEVRGRRLAVYGRGITGVRFALALTVWSPDLVLCTDGAPRLPHAARLQLDAHGIRLRTERIVRLEGEGGALRRIVFEQGPAEQRDALFFHAGTRQRSSLVRDLGCTFTRAGAVRTGEFEEAGLEGLHVAGDASEAVNFVAVAAAEGVKAAVAINRALREEDSRARVLAHVRALQRNRQSGGKARDPRPAPARRHAARRTRAPAARRRS